MKPKIIVAGAGGIGRAVALILAESDIFEAQIFLGDLYIDTAHKALDWIVEGLGSKICNVSVFEMQAEGISAEMQAIFDQSDIILDCLPGSVAPRMARFAKQFSLHYANLTEYVKETKEIEEIAKDADTGFVLQTGLAPGFINVLAHKLYQEFQAEYHSDILEKLSMKVGALSKNAQAPHFYAFTWSPIGVATEYVKEAIVVKDFKKQMVPSLSDSQTILIEGIEYEDNYTSGGAANLPDAFSGKIKNIEYKTLRYPGHYDWVKNVIKTIPENSNLPMELERKMLEEIPALDDDVVIIFASAVGRDPKGILRSIEKSYRIEPGKIGENILRAIQSTTAAPMCEIARMLLEGDKKGIIYQTDIDTEEFLNGPFVSKVYGAYNLS
jgi:saccharopine dehydrogenase-like NADP-dependent oxidoreductase